MLDKCIRISFITYYFSVVDCIFQLWIVLHFSQRKSFLQCLLAFLYVQQLVTFVPRQMCGEYQNGRISNKAFGTLSWDNFFPGQFFGTLFLWDTFFLGHFFGTLFFWGTFFGTLLWENFRQMWGNIGG